MKKRLDIYLGLAAWVIALVSPFLEFCVDFLYDSEVQMWVVPLLWTCTVAAMIICKKRPLRKLWWVWFSALFAV